MSRIDDLERALTSLESSVEAKIAAVAAPNSKSVWIPFWSAIVVAVLSTGGLVTTTLITASAPADPFPPINCGNAYQDAIVLNEVDGEWRYPESSQEQKQCNVNGLLEGIDQPQPQPTP